MIFWHECDHNPTRIVAPEDTQGVHTPVTAKSIRYYLKLIKHSIQKTITTTHMNSQGITEAAQHDSCNGCGDQDIKPNGFSMT